MWFSYHEMLHTYFRCDSIVSVNCPLLVDQVVSSIATECVEFLDSAVVNDVMNL